MKILTLDIDSSSLKQLTPVVVEMGVEMLTAHNIAEALYQIEKQHPDILLLDREAQESTGYAIISQMGGGAKAIPVVFLTRSAEPAPKLDGRPTATVTRPIHADELKQAIGRVTGGGANVSHHTLGPGQVADLGEYGTMLCNSRAMHDVINMVDQVAGTNITILVRGESGTGKELIARTIYQRSLRKDKPFVKVLCAALPEGLLESELFGYERGAFTGAHKRKPGKFEFANHGTIFLDEIGEVPITLQSKLLQVVQDGEFVRLGGEQDVRVDVRIVAATNRDLEQCVAAGTFREDLFYRLNVVAITIPPLRERLEEVPFLCDFFIDKFSRQYQRAFPRLSRATMDYFMSYPWPGNIRELENMIKQIVVLGDEGTVLKKFAQFHDTGMGGHPSAPSGGSGAVKVPTGGLPGQELLGRDGSPFTPGPLSRAFRPDAPPAPAPAPPAMPGAPQGERSMDLRTIIGKGLADGHLPLKEIGKQAASIAEREAILEVLSHTRWNRRKAAAILDISYKALLYKIRDYGLNE
ncbi:MAG: sigma-54-dependent Fis family transcriptional regulator [Nitrospirae bacterium]|nr:sigma-54-dependent Fis family transcriptional regulator [Nitrospirota bacterium]